MELACADDIDVKLGVGGSRHGIVLASVATDQGKLVCPLDSLEGGAPPMNAS